jgi:hypothetical protein
VQVDRSSSEEQRAHTHTPGTMTIADYGGARWRTIVSTSAHPSDHNEPAPLAGLDGQHPAAEPNSEPDADAGDMKSKVEKSLMHKIEQQADASAGPRA